MLFRPLLLILISISYYGQDTHIQLSGEILSPPSDTLTVECFTDGRLVDKDVFVGKFYELRLGDAPHYTVKISSGAKVKYCSINCNFMKTEKIPVDVDFATNYNAEIYLEKPNDKYFTMRLYDRYRVKYTEIERTTSEY